MPTARSPVGVILAGGQGARIGGSKAIVELRGRPLITYPCEVLREAVGEVVIVAKADTELPGIPGVTVWVEPQTPRHPLIGIMHALSLAEGRPVLSCPVDLPFITPEVVRQLAQAEPGAAPAVIAATAETTQPLFGCFQARALGLLQAVGNVSELPTRDAITAIGALTVGVDPLTLFNINSPDDLLQASAMLDQIRTTSRT